ncbi:MAG: glycerol-3-phosphate 1-O-acyltransferase PlsY [Rhodocyclaceae bacterium]|jgi:glycerol-3-phosphate acyltransferase PlsY|nr:glycerol-3-phosphate 1-O-acyltransferase PlsY [Rhodocyclaceae bacterium]
MNTLLVALGAYLLGSIPFAVVTSRLFGLADPRNYGSGNPGATNVLRSGNKLAALATLIGDALKGWLPVWLISRHGADFGLSEWHVALAGLAAFLGHLYPVTLGFKGGKGVATALGVLAGFGGWIALGCAGLWIGVAAATRYSSAAALCAALAAPALAHWLGAPPPLTGATVVMALLLFWRHAANIQRLLAGTESRLGGAKKG